MEPAQLNIPAAPQPVEQRSRPVAPGGSTLPRLAAELPHACTLLDPHHGAEVVARQLKHLAEHLAPGSAQPD
ncbi:DUF1152 domain-containing protein [Streptomyces sp. NBC_01210]|uniref:hypothetical protein n=1 Tax=Streptomyces sp. NBC_01210 TaxID=2903774 RepID=UPI002E0F485E|nr:DUF1152 domain-containing protein [Streptomyces sp. NBC_01210]